MPEDRDYRALVTHPGGAHKDEFLACCVLLARHPVPVYRREPSAADLADAGLAVIDVGGEHAPERGNFDHHQFAADAPPRCALSLVLEDLELYEDARTFCAWLETAEWFDCRGPQATAAHLGVSRELLERLISPMDVTLLRRFASSTELQPGEPLWELMRWTGEDLLSYLGQLRQRMAFLAQHTERWTLQRPGDELAVLFLPRTEPLPDEPSQGLELFVRRQMADAGIRALIYPDRRGGGYGLSRFRDDPATDFTRITEEPDVHFAHNRGFVAKTSASEPRRLRELMERAWREGRS